MVQYGTGDLGVDMDDSTKILEKIFDTMNSFEDTVITTTIKSSRTITCKCGDKWLLPVQYLLWCGWRSQQPGVMPTAEHTLAVDAYNPFVPDGEYKIIMNGIEYTVEDTGAFDQLGVQFDVSCNDHATASAWGHQTFEAFGGRG